MSGELPLLQLLSIMVFLNFIALSQKSLMPHCFALGCGVGGADMDNLYNCYFILLLGDLLLWLLVMKLLERQLPREEMFERLIVVSPTPLNLLAPTESKFLGYLNYVVAAVLTF